jgi:hypothetical protein
MAGVLASCSSKKESTEPTTQTTKEEKMMKQTGEVDSVEPVTSSDQSIKPPTTSASEEPKETIDPKTLALLEDFGDAWVNYNGVTERNQKLAPLVSQKVAEIFGINPDFDSGNSLSSKGEVTQIYQPVGGNENSYALYVEFEKNGSPWEEFLLVEVEDNKISELTYNTLKLARSTYNEY